MAYYKGGSEGKELTFNAQNSNYFDWFEHRKLISSSWSDLKLAKDVGLFSFRGPCNYGLCQNFHVVKAVAYATCENVVGWIYRGTLANCEWEKATAFKMVYCKGTTSCNFSRQSEF